MLKGEWVHVLQSLPEKVTLGRLKSSTERISPWVRL